MRTILCLAAVLAVSQGGKLDVEGRRMRSPAGTKAGQRVSQQMLNCYDRTSGGGDIVSAIDYIPDLRNYNMDNRIESCCFTGIWMLYAEGDYNGYSTGSANWWAFGDNNCLDVPPQFANAASSLRFTGAPDDWKYDTLNFYFNDYFIGDEEFTYNSMPQLNYDNRARSLIVTGCDVWTLYTDRNYGGLSMCVYPADSSDCTPGLYPNSQTLGNLAGQISSARRGGCFAEKKLYPVNYGMRTFGNGTSGFFPGKK